jgi:hypothetical protein
MTEISYHCVFKNVDRIQKQTHVLRVKNIFFFLRIENYT